MRANSNDALIEREDMRRRCVAHDKWMSENPAAVAFHEAWADTNLTELNRL